MTVTSSVNTLALDTVAPGSLSRVERKRHHNREAQRRYSMYNALY
jgi:hypothetical protein